mmetsp:Transcript_17437/g.31448  ORF Transcript_17437/g.31448 Transcript_17437/m.31448 type:complete len:88 (-) Transcript_17437:243-506(-)
MILAWTGILMDPTRHIIYDTQFNPSSFPETCEELKTKDPHDLMTAAFFFKLNILCLVGQWAGYTVLFLLLGEDLVKAWRRAAAAQLR